MSTKLLLLSQSELSLFKVKTQCAENWARKKSSIREKLNLLTDADCSTATKMERNGRKPHFFSSFLYFFLGGEGGSVFFFRRGKQFVVFFFMRFLSSKIVHKKCPQKAEGEWKVRGRGAEGERQGRGRWAAGDPANSPTIAKLDAGADWCLDPTTMSGEDQRKLSSARQFLTIYEQKL